MVNPRHYPGQVAFVGSWNLRAQGDGRWSGYHDEWAPHRRAMLDACRNRYGRDFECYPRAQRGGLRGQQLADLYATVPVLVGDSCLAPIEDPPARYWSDRVPETLGRGGLLVHPDVEGLMDLFDAPVLAGALGLYRIGDYDEMFTRIDEALSLSDEDRTAARMVARRWVQDHHTYEVRMRQLVDVLVERNLISEQQATNEGTPL